VCWNRVLRRIFITVTDEVTGGERKLLVEGLVDFYILMMTLARTGAACG